MQIETEFGGKLELHRVVGFEIRTKSASWFRGERHWVVAVLESSKDEVKLTKPNYLLNSLEKLHKLEAELKEYRSYREKVDCSGVDVFIPDREVTVVIPCHEQGEFLSDALQSLRDSYLRPSRILLIDDSSRVPLELSRLPRDLTERVEVFRVNFRDAHKVRGFGLNLVKTPYVLFLDADNKVRDRYLSDAIQKMEFQRDIAFVYPMLHAFGDGKGIWHSLDKAPKQVSGRDLTYRNWCDSGSVYRTEVLRQVNPYRLVMTSDCTSPDWRVARDILLAGSWRGVMSDIGLDYRVHPNQLSYKPEYSYVVDADLKNEIITIVVAFSGRWPEWEKVRSWILKQTYPVNKTRLLILNSSHSPVNVERLGLRAWRGRGLQIEDVETGYVGLADEDRRLSVDVRRKVEVSVSKIYNLLPGLIPYDYAFILEDDVEPTRFDVIERLMESLDADVAAVSGLYQHRYGDFSTAIGMEFDPDKMELMSGPEKQLVGGSGFGCLLLRLDVLKRFPLAADHPKRVHYDVNFSYEVKKAGWKWVLDRGVFCRHHFRKP